MLAVLSQGICCTPTLSDNNEVVSVVEIGSCFKKSRFFGNTVDNYIARNTINGRPPDQSPSKRKKKQGDTDQLVATKQHDFGLPPIESEYELDPKQDLETGYGTGLKRYINKKTKMARAVLSLRKDNIPQDMSTGDVRRQLELLCRLDHPNIVLFRECFEDHSHLKLVYDWCDGGPLMLQLWRYEGKLTEGHVAQVMREVLAALANAHSFGVHHLDLGLFSLFLTFTDRLSPIKLFGLGLAGFLIPAIHARRTSRSNKHFYASPEMFLMTKVKGMSPTMKHSSDVWSVGTMLYTLCSGRPPFGVGTYNQVSAKVQRSSWSFGLEFSQYSIACKEMIELLLKLPWQKRISAAQAIRQAWVSHAQSIQVKNGAISDVAFKQLTSFVEQDHVKQTVARMLTDIGIASDCYTELEEKFRELDLNGDGSLSLGELMEVASALPGLTPSAVDRIVRKLDRNGNANVDIHEFIAALVLSQDEADPRLVRKAFHKMDKNGDARVTKKELFLVLREYSGTIKTDEVSKFIGETDDDGDQKVDYREFMKLFPQVKDRDLAQRFRMEQSKLIISCGIKCLSDFRDALKAWLDKLVKKRDFIEIGCGVKALPNDFKGSHYSYEKGHFTEFEVQLMIEEIMLTVQQVPGYNETKEQRRAKKERKKKAAEDPLSVGSWSQQMMGVSILAKKDQTSEENTLEEEDTEEHVTDDQDKPKQKSAMQHWIRQITLDRQERIADQVYKAESQVYDCLFWLVKVKSEFQWQKPLQRCITKLREACVEEISEVTIHRKFELSRLQGLMNEQYVVREDVEVNTGDIGERSTICRGSRLVPMGAMKGKNLKITSYLEKLDEMKTPVNLVFALAKEEITHQKIEHMQNTHLEQMRWVGVFVTSIIDSVESLFLEVQEDLEMSATLESLMPCPPPVSHLFLKHCLGRDIADDAATPREDVDESYLDNNEEEIPEAIFSSSQNLSSRMDTKDGLSSSSSRQGTKDIERASSYKDRIERNRVLATNKAASPSKAQTGTGSPDNSPSKRSSSSASSPSRRSP